LFFLYYCIIKMNSPIGFNTVEVTYLNTTRPINYVWSNVLDFNMNRHFMCLTLWTFRDMLPDYQDYEHLQMPFNYKLDKSAILTLPVKKYTYSIETLGHGEITGTYTNEFLLKYCPRNFIISQISEELGIKRELIKLIDHDGLEVQEQIYTQHPNITLLAIFDSLDNKLEEKGIENLDYTSRFRAGETMLVYRAAATDELYDLNILQFKQSPFIIVKRTPKMVLIRDTRNNSTFRKKIQNSITFGEKVMISGTTILMKYDSIKFSKPYHQKNR